MMTDVASALRTGEMPPRKSLVKKGTIEIAVVETTPVVWKDRLLRFEWVRNSQWGNAMGTNREKGCYRFVDMHTDEALPEFAEDHAFGCCYEEDGVMYVHGVRGEGGGNVIDSFVSRDLCSWSQSTALVLPQDIAIYNTSVCKSPDGYVMAIEIGGSNPMVGVPFTCIFALSADLLNWTLLPTQEHCYARDRYTACPTLRWYDGWYYMIYLESAPCARWLPYIVRSKDLRLFEPGLRNPIMIHSDEDKQLVRPDRFSPEEQAYIQNAVNCNNSDVDLCLYNGKTVILYSWGNQLGKEFLALAEYDGPPEAFLASFF